MVEAKRGSRQEPAEVERFIKDEDPNVTLKNRCYDVDYVTASHDILVAVKT